MDEGFLKDVVLGVVLLLGFVVNDRKKLIV